MRLPRCGRQTWLFGFLALLAMAHRPAVAATVVLDISGTGTNSAGVTKNFTAQIAYQSGWRTVTEGRFNFTGLTAPPHVFSYQIDGLPKRTASATENYVVYSSSKINAMDPAYTAFELDVSVAAGGSTVVVKIPYATPLSNRYHWYPPECFCFPTTQYSFVVTPTVVGGDSLNGTISSIAACRAPAPGVPPACLPVVSCPAAACQPCCVAAAPSAPVSGCRTRRPGLLARIFHRRRVCG